MKVISLQSGSNGNSIYVEANGTRLLFDAGISGSKAASRLSVSGRDMAQVDALLISHDHRDHTSAMGVYQRRYRFPIYVTQATLAAAAASQRLGQLRDLCHFTSGDRLEIGGVVVETISTPHDGVDGVGFVVDDGRRRLGILTDLGHVFRELVSVVDTLDAVVLESNYDPAMLATGRYPELLKRRIRGPGGHLSNVEAAELLDAAARSRLEWACLAHLSEENNSPKVALETHRAVLGRQFRLHVATRYVQTEVLEI